MALAALISATQAIEDAEGEALRATLPLAGTTLIEHQARLAAAAGTGSIVILVERLPAALTAAVDRLRRDGLTVEIARDLSDAVDRVHPDEKLLLIADGCIAAPELVLRMAEAASPTVLTVPDDAGSPFERIDAGARWGGLLLIDGARLRRTAAMLGEWDLESTLLRRAVQEGAARVPAYEEGEALLAIPASLAELESLDRAVIAAARGPARDWPARFLFPPVVDVAALRLVRRGVEPFWVAAGGVALALLALPFALYRLHWLALLLLLLSGPVVAIADRLAAVRLSAIPRGRLLAGTRVAAATLALLLLAADLAGAAGWGSVLLALLVPALMAALAREATTLVRAGGRPTPIWLASLDGLIWAMLPPALLGAWLPGIALLAVYAAASFGLVQHRLARVIAAQAV